MELNEYTSILILEIKYNMLKIKIKSLIHVHRNQIMYFNLRYCDIDSVYKKCYLGSPINKKN